ncbi:MAG: PfkB family carbohydrate kinase [Gammaproteobacteria bacterium]|nr:PfkB family carbohydrate kinase [Gammaproteobacteria bacterium]MCW8910183.1 PfkB family carbohydrate kinase [Gammaproteobacteria bacterium]MCW9055144.1 PfkB family carbohydrate kinase [Gammaproteobacteria bacterium]
MSNILLTGIVVLDIINYVDSYPKEDSEIRALNQKIRRGGNASNTATILSQLKHSCTLATNLPTDTSGQFLSKDLDKNNIKLAILGTSRAYTSPTSYITINIQNASRSIIHYRDLPELSFTQFDKILLNTIDWFHFEGRNIRDTSEMMKKSHGFNKSISVEIEKDRDNIDSLIPLADIIFFSRPFAESRNFSEARDCLKHFNSIYPDKLLICTWGTEGAFAIHNSQEFFSSAFYIDKAIDTIGAGDTFNAGFIHAQLNKLNINESLIYACKLAGLKCTKDGLTNLDIFDV